jgi:hypothetical protein
MILDLILFKGYLCRENFIWNVKKELIGVSIKALIEVFMKLLLRTATKELIEADLKGLRESIRLWPQGVAARGCFSKIEVKAHRKCST